MPTTHSRPQELEQHLPQPVTVVLLGDVGTGKSTVAEKVSGSMALSSTAQESFTKQAQAFTSTCGRVVLIDTPGCNPMKDKVEKNLCIAHAFNFRPVSLILIVVKADMRKDSVVDGVRKLAEQFIQLSTLLGVCVTYMDEKYKWQPQDLIADLDDQLGLSRVIFSSSHKQGSELTDDILRFCQAPQDVSITSKNFLDFFKLHSSSLRILAHVKKESEDIAAIDTHLRRQLDNLDRRDKFGLLYDFQTYVVETAAASQQISPEAEAEEVSCRFCLEGAEAEELISPCKCSGGQKYVHLKCLRQWQRRIFTKQGQRPHAASSTSLEQELLTCFVCESHFSCALPTLNELRAQPGS